LKNAQFEALYTNLSLNPVWKEAHHDKDTAAVHVNGSLPTTHDSHDHAPVVTSRSYAAPSAVSSSDSKYALDAKSPSSLSSTSLSPPPSLGVTVAGTTMTATSGGNITRSTSPTLRTMTGSSSTSTIRSERFIGGGTGTVMVLAQSSSSSARYPYSPPASPSRQSRSLFARSSSTSSTITIDDLPAHSRPTIMGSLLLGILPPELQYMFCDFLDHSSLCAASMVCKEWQRTARDDTLWQAGIPPIDAFIATYYISI
jgi:hypothetical protein